MASLRNGGRYTIVFDPTFDRILHKLKRRKPALFNELRTQIEKAARAPILGKPLRNVLRNYRRLSVDSFVLLYEIKDLEIRFLDFDHHNRIYKKYSS